MTDHCRIAVLVSGSGSNLQAFLDQQASGDLAGEVIVVLSNVADAFALKRARNAAVPTEVVRHTDFDSREAFDQAVAEVLDRYEPDLVLLAGFMRILTPGFVRHYSGRLLNIHPSLLPKYPGLHTHQRALEAGDATHGATVHFVTDELDGGPPIIQARVPVLDGDTPETLAQRVLTQEHRIYPQAANWYATGRLSLVDGCVILDGERLDSPVLW